MPPSAYTGISKSTWIGNCLSITQSAYVRPKQHSFGELIGESPPPHILWNPSSCMLKQVFVEPPSALNIMLPVFAAERRRLQNNACQQARGYWLISPARRALSSKPAGHRCCCRSMGQRDRQTSDCYTDTVPHSMRAASTRQHSIEHWTSV